MSGQFRVFALAAVGWLSLVGLVGAHPTRVTGIGSENRKPAPACCPAIFVSKTASSPTLSIPILAELTA